MVKKQESCDLCGLAIEGPPVIKVFDGVEKHFCCQGCARVYTVAHENDLLGSGQGRPSAQAARDRN